MPPITERLAVTLCFFLNGLLFASWVSRIPAVQTRLGLTHGELGLALLSMGFGAVLAMPLAGWCSVRFGGRRVTQLSAVIYCVVLPLLALASNAGLLMLALFIFGAVHGAFDVAMNAQAIAVEERCRRPIMSSFHALWSVGGLTGAALGSAVAAYGIAPLAHFSAAGLLIGGMACALVLRRLPESGETQPHALTDGDERRPHLTWPSRQLLALGAIAFCVMMGEGAMADWSAIFLRDSAGASEAVAAAGYAAFSIAMALGRFSGDRLTAQFGGVTLLRWSGAIAVTGLTVALLFPQPILTLIGFAAVGAGFAVVVPVVFSAAGRIPGAHPGSALATATTLGYSGFLIGPPFIGFMAEVFGLRSALGLIVATSALLILLARNVEKSGQTFLDRTEVRRVKPDESGFPEHSPQLMEG